MSFCDAIQEIEIEICFWQHRLMYTTTLYRLIFFVGNEDNNQSPTATAQRMAPQNAICQSRRGTVVQQVHIRIHSQ